MPQFWFPLSYFQHLPNLGPSRSPSRFSQLVSTAWDLESPKQWDTKRVYYEIISNPEPCGDEQSAYCRSAKAAMFNMLFGYKEWLDMLSAERGQTDPFVQAIVGSMNDILLTQSTATPSPSTPALPASLKDYSGYDILKLMLLVNQMSASYMLAAS